MKTSGSRPRSSDVYTGSTFKPPGGRKRSPILSQLIVIVALMVLVAILASYFIVNRRSALIGSEVVMATTTAERTIRNGFEAIEPVRVKLPNSETSVNGYNYKQIINATTSSRSALTDALNYEELNALEDYVIQAYPIPPDQPAGNIFVDPEQSLVTGDVKNEIYETVVSFIRKIRGIAESDRLTVNLEITSQPAGAAYDMWPKNGPHRTTSTPNTIDNLYRGIYYYKVNKSGFKTIEYTLNLVDSDGDHLHCTLHTDNQSDGPYPCNLHR